MRTLHVDERQGAVASTMVPEHATRETLWHEASYRPEVVRVTTLDSFCETSGLAPTFLKIDVEGAEEMVIRGGRITIERHLPMIWFECWCGIEENKPINERLQHFQILSRAGYRFFLATLFKLKNRWVSETSTENPTQLLPLTPSLIDRLPVMGCDILAARPDQITRLSDCSLISNLSASAHLEQICDR
jgi:hypothetical protein